MRSGLRGVADTLPSSLGHLGERAAETWRETRRAYRAGRAAGDPTWRPAGGADEADAGSASGGASGARRTRAGKRQDPEMAGWYANLEVPYGSDLDTVTRAWKRLARLYHPDRHDSDPERRAHASDLFKGITHAYEQLRRRLDSPSGRS